MSTKELFYFTGLCLSLDDNPEHRETIHHSFTTGKVNPDEFIFLCDKHLILPAIYLKFKNYDLLSLFPEEYKNHLAAIYLQNKQRNISILQQVDEINEKLAGENIVPVYLKGTAILLDNVYSDAGERMIGDIDVLVQDKDYLKSATLVQQLGYQADGKAFHDVTTSKHFPRLFRTDVPADIEIHRIPVDIKYSKRFSTEMIFQDKKQLLNHLNCFVPSDIHKAIHNFIHGQLGNLGHGFKLASLRDLYDVHLLMNRINADALIDQTAEKKRLLYYLALTHQVFNTKSGIPETENKYVERHLKRFDWYLEHPRRHHRHIFRVKTTELIFHRFFPGCIQIFTPKFRTGFFNYITDPDWYRMILFRVKNFYNNYISGIK